MVKKYIILLTLPLILFSNAIYSVVITTSIDNKSNSANRPIEGFITINNIKNQMIDESSFKIGGQSLKVDYITTKNKYQKSYRFILPPKPPGTHILAPITLKIDDKFYHSQPQTYQIDDIEETSFFSLESSVEGFLPIHPGQHIKFVYRLKTNGNIDVTYENMPLLNNNKDFEFIGDLNYQKYVSDDNLLIQEFSQEAKVLKPGSYHYPSSILEGYPYYVNDKAKHIYVNKKWRARSKPTIISVADFPKEKRPYSFNGVIGDNYNISIDILNPSKKDIREKIKLALTISGKGYFSTVQAPDLSLQKGFENFRLSNIAEKESQSNNSKTFFLTLYPQNYNVDKIPAIEFSYFSPQHNSYIIKHLNPISLSNDNKKFVKDMIHLIAPNFKLTKQTLIRANLTLNKTILISIALIIFLLIQVKLFHSNVSFRFPRQSKKYFKKALDENLKLEILEKALINKLYEKKHINKIYSHASELPRGSMTNEVRYFMKRLEKSYFTQKQSIDKQQVLSDFKRLFKKI